ncbi:MAG: sugar transporter substrate-binding protein, partial [Aeromicrobium sp.]|uniref:substrate-binding domain-containing protein n=1 Tax=Aeromicrobium sp. TaxID=1871063 RepID=UPI0026372D82
MHRHTRRIAAVATITALALTGCSAADSGKKSDNNSAASKKAEQALKDIQGKVLSKGPHGEDPSEASAADLSDADIADIKSKKATAAIVMHYGGNDWAAAQIDGLKSQFAKMGIKLVATTDANFKPDKQVSDLETVMSKKPDIIVSIPTDPVATASAYKKAADAGIKLVFMDNVPNGLKAGTDYVSVVSADNYGNGVTSAHMMAKALGGKGQIGLIHHEADFFVTKQ